MGSLKGTSLNTLLVESGEMPLDLRKMLARKLRILINNDNEGTHPLSQSIKDCWQYHYTPAKSKHPPFGQRTFLDDTGIDQEPIKTPFISPFPPWHLRLPSISMELTNYISKNDHPAMQLQRSLEIIHLKWDTFIHAYTDGSKVPNSGRTAAAFHIPYFKKTEAKRLQNYISIFRAELAAIILLLNWINQNCGQFKTNLVIFSDSLSALQAIQNSQKEDMITEILLLITQIYYKGINIFMEWIPGHCGINGNDIVDWSAKSAITHPQIDVAMTLNKTEIKSLIKNQFKSMWQSRWDKDSSFLRSIHKSVSKTHDYNLAHRKYEILLFRMRSGNIGLNTNLQKIGKHESGLCDLCDQPETIQHYLLEFPQYLIPRAMLFAEIKKDQEQVKIEEILNAKNKIRKWL